MKTVVGLVVTLVTVSGYLINVPVSPIAEPTFAPAGWIHLQKLILPLFENVCEESDNPSVVRLSEEFWTTTSAADFWNADCFTKLQQLKSSGTLMARGVIFTEYNPEHITELKIVSEVLKNAKTFDTFYKAACWARQNLNCGLFVDAIYLALENRRDLEKISLPAPYELLPNYFIRKDIIIQSSSILAGQAVAPTEGVRDEGNAYTLDANYTSDIHEGDDESRLAYYREDVGLNSYYFLNMLKYAPWNNLEVDINSRYGENMYFWMKQWMSRYNLERLSNDLPELDGMNWDLVSDLSYDPMLVYSNGNDFIHSASHINIEENEDKALLKTIEANLNTVVGHMRDSGYNKTQILNHLMEILFTGERSYENLARRLLGKALTNDGNRSVLEHYMTSLRDPMFWKLNKKIVDLIDNALRVLPAYTKNELYFPGVEVVNVEVKKMMTSFQNFEFDITDALKIGNGDSTFHVKIGQPRLSHKPFTMKINISSLVTQKGMVKVYLGPKIAPGEFSKKKNLFSLFDCFDINLKKGPNMVTRSSDDLTRFSSDFVSIKTLHKNVVDAQFGLDSLPLNSISTQIQYPSRLVLPKGTTDGLPLQILVFVAPYIKTSLTGAYSSASTEFNEAVMSKIYPLDLPIDDNMLLGLPNLMFKDTIVTFKSSGGGSGAKGGYVRPSQPNAWGSSQPDQDNIYPGGGYGGGYQTKASYEKTDYKQFDYKNINKDVTPKNMPTEAPLQITTQSLDDIMVIDSQNHEVLGVYEMQNDSPVKEPTSLVRGQLKQSSQKSGLSFKKFDYKSIIKDNKVKNKENITQESPQEVQIGVNTTKYVDIGVVKIPYVINKTIDKKMDRSTSVETENENPLKHVDVEVVRIPYVVNKTISQKNYENEREDTENANTVKHVDVEVVKIPYVFDKTIEPKFDTGKSEETEDVGSLEHLEVLGIDGENKEIRFIPVLRMSKPMNKAFTIYDFIIHSFDDDKEQKTDNDDEASKGVKKQIDGEDMVKYIYVE